MIITEGVNKYFDEAHVLKNVSFEIKQGEIVGFLGQNGAGKTTLMRILTSYLPANSGKVIVAGEDVNKKMIALRRKIGYLPENPPLYPNMIVKDYLRFAAELKDVHRREINIQIDRVLQECNLNDVKNKVIATLSKGYKQRVGIAQAIINNPQVLILDEPTNGLDPLQVIQVRKLIKNLETQRTVILSTHILSEIEQIAQRILVIKSGEILRDMSLQDLLVKEQSKTLEEAFLKIVS